MSEENQKNEFLEPTLNIPSQILKRDPTNNQFLYFNITFTEVALYENL